MQAVRIVPERHASVGLQVVDVDILVNVHDVLPLGVDFNEYLLLSHGFDDLADVGAGFLEVMEFLAEHSDGGVEFVAAGFETGEVGGSGVDLVGEGEDAGGVVGVHGDFSRLIWLVLVRPVCGLIG
jgi:hypothetical protein